MLYSQSGLNGRSQHQPVIPQQFNPGVRLRYTEGAAFGSSATEPDPYIALAYMLS